MCCVLHGQKHAIVIFNYDFKKDELETVKVNCLSSDKQFFWGVTCQETSYKRTAESFLCSAILHKK